jgi:hypothetical protein
MGVISHFFEETLAEPSAIYDSQVATQHLGLTFAALSKGVMNIWQPSCCSMALATLAKCESIAASISRRPTSATRLEASSGIAIIYPH